jgi:hypothetical protein
MASINQINRGACILLTQKVQTFCLSASHFTVNTNRFPIVTGTRFISPAVIPVYVHKSATSPLVQRFLLEWTKINMGISITQLIIDRFIDPFLRYLSMRFIFFPFCHSERTDRVVNKPYASKCLFC